MRRGFLLVILSLSMLYLRVLFVLCVCDNSGHVNKASDNLHARLATVYMRCQEGTPAVMGPYQVQCASCFSTIALVCCSNDLVMFSMQSGVGLLSIVGLEVSGDTALAIYLAHMLTTMIVDVPAAPWFLQNVLTDVLTV